MVLRAIRCLRCVDIIVLLYRILFKRCLHSPLCLQTHEYTKYRVLLLDALDSY
jgi:hypothetical protein